MKKFLVLVFGAVLVASISGCSFKIELPQKADEEVKEK